jgi:Kef-type K+ transport system membrane component KefB
MELTLPVTDGILQFTILVAAALAVQLTVERLHLPGIVGLLVIGMLIGPGGAGVLPREPVVALLGSVGLVYIMFLAGLEIDLDVVRRHRGEVVLFGVLAFTLSLAPAVGVGLAAGMGVGGALLLGAALSSHTLVAYPLVERYGLVHRRPIVAAIGGTLLTDTLALVLLAVTIQTVGSDGGPLGWILPLAGLAALAAGALSVVPRVARRFFASEGADRAEKALFVLAVLMVLSAAAELIRTEDILGAFIAGVALNRAVREREELHEHLAFVGRMLFIPFFFVETGMRLELEVFTGRGETWLLAGVLLLVVLAGKGAATWIAGARYGYSGADRTAMVGLTVPQAAATLAVTVTAAERGVMGGEVVDAVIVVIFVTCLAGPLLVRSAARRLSDGTREGEGEGGAAEEKP